MRVETEIGHFVLKAWVTEGIKPGVVACSHHMGRWKPADEGAPGQRQLMATVELEREEAGGRDPEAGFEGAAWSLSRRQGAAPYETEDPDTSRIWWTDVGVHQNLTFPVHPDPVSGMHCWHQAVRVVKASRRDRHGDIHVDTDKAHRVYREWLDKTRGAQRHSPDGTRRPHWLIRPLRPVRDAYDLPDSLPAQE